MRYFRVLLYVCLGALSAIWIPNVKADQANQLTTVTFDEPVEVPGKVLPPGTYVFTLLDNGVDRDVVQILSKDQSKLYATVLTIPDERLTPTGKTVITFEHRTPGAPQAIRAWFYPGDEFGHEFVYPRKRARELAKASNQSVPCMEDSLGANIIKPAKSGKEAGVMAMKKAHLKTVSPSGDETEVAMHHHKKH